MKKEESEVLIRRCGVGRNSETPSIPTAGIIITV
jgi:hypothetical protein